MLEMSMDLEADLAFDSIKRVEIMWAFQEKFLNLPQISNSEMGELRTLQQIADHLQNLSPSSESASLSPDMIQASETQEAEKKKL
jgi:Phosphopantetheine attachment site.